MVTFCLSTGKDVLMVIHTELAKFNVIDERPV